MPKIINKKLESYILILDRLQKKIKFKRIFFLVANKNIIRGYYAHKKFYIQCVYSDGKKEKITIKPGEKLKIIKPLTWVKVYLKKNNICGVLCDRHYEEKDYIRDYKKFNEILDKL